MAPMRPSSKASTRPAALVMLPVIVNLRTAGIELKFLQLQTSRLRPDASPCDPALDGKRRYVALFSSQDAFQAPQIELPARHRLLELRAMHDEPAITAWLLPHDNVAGRSRSAACPRNSGRPGARIPPQRPNDSSQGRWSLPGSRSMAKWPCKIVPSRDSSRPPEPEIGMSMPSNSRSAQDHAPAHAAPDLALSHRVERSCDFSDSSARKLNVHGPLAGRNRPHSRNNTALLLVLDPDVELRHLPDAARAVRVIDDRSILETDRLKERRGILPPPRACRGVGDRLGQIEPARRRLCGRYASASGLRSVGIRCCRSPTTFAWLREAQRQAAVCRA